MYGFKDDKCKVEIYSKEQIDEMINEEEEKGKRKINENEETETNEYIDEKRVYVKRINLGMLPHTDRIIIETGLDDIDLVRIEGRAIGGDEVQLPLPFSHPSESAIGILYKKGDLYIDTGSDRSDYIGYVNLYYTKN